MDTAYQHISVSFKELNLPDKISVRDLWSQKDLGLFNARYTALIPPHGVKLLKVK